MLSTGAGPAYSNKAARSHMKLATATATGTTTTTQANDNGNYCFRQRPHEIRMMNRIRRFIENGAYR